MRKFKYILYREKSVIMIIREQVKIHKIKRNHQHYYVDGLSIFREKKVLFIIKKHQSKILEKINNAKNFPNVLVQLL